MRRLKRLLLGGLSAGLVLAALGWLLLAFPSVMFASSVHVNGLSLYSDRPFDLQAGRKVLEGVEARLKTSPLYTSGDRHAAYICNTTWRRALFMIANRRAGGLNYYPMTTNVFLSGAVVEDNRLISSSGRVVEAARPLDYFIAHEITHSLSARVIGTLEFRRLANWAKEGYAEYVARGAGFDYDRDIQAFLANAPEMNQPPSVPYLRYRFLVAHLIEREGWKVPAVLESTLTQQAVESMVRDGTDQSR